MGRRRSSVFLWVEGGRDGRKLPELFLLPVGLGEEEAVAPSWTQELSGSWFPLQELDK